MCLLFQDNAWVVNGTSLKRVCLFLFGAFLLPIGMHAMSVDAVVKQTGIAAGLCAFPNATKQDTALVLELAQKTNFVVHVSSHQTKVLSDVRAKAETAGLLGRSLYVEEATTNAILPFADRLVDLLIVSDLRDADLKPGARDAWLKALAPGRGAALVGRSKAAGSGLTETALKAWVKDLPSAKVFSDASGVWAMLRTNLPVGSDAWTHRLHGPENSDLSSDIALQAPFLTQWWGLPRQEGYWGTTVVACNGRLFTVRACRDPAQSASLSARSVNNGLVLWQRDLAHLGADGKKLPQGGFNPARSCVVATEDSLYLADGSCILRLDAETGVERARIAGPDPAGQIKWFAVSGKLLAIMVGSPDVLTSSWLQTAPTNPVGRELMVYDTEKSNVLWRETVTGNIDERMIVVRDQQMYDLVQGVGLECRDLVRGKVIWMQTDPALLSEFITPEAKVPSDIFFSVPVLSALTEELILRAKWAKTMFVFSRRDGTLLWKQPAGAGNGFVVTGCVVSNAWIDGGQFQDLKTGQKTQRIPFINSRCSTTTATPAYLVTGFGSVFDVKSGQMIRHEDVKGPCDHGSIISDGLLVTTPSECGCNGYTLKGYRALASAGAIPLHSASSWQERLTVIDKSEPASLEATSTDWPTYRHDSARSAGNAVSVGCQPNILWRWTPAGATTYERAMVAIPTLGYRLAPDFLPTAPVAVAGFVWFASADGTIRCVQAATGKEVWAFPTAAMVFAPPTIWKGRVLVGGGDGRIYCLDAMTGRCLWKFLAAPCDRRVFWYGHLISTWPVITGVVVHDDIAYAVAGYQKENGTHAYALDPRNGTVIWEKHDAGKGTKEASLDGFGSFGNCAVGAGRLWINSASSTPGSFDLKSGHWDPIESWPWPGDWSGQFGSEIGVFDETCVLHGGPRLSETQDNQEKAAAYGFTGLKLPQGFGYASCPVDNKPMQRYLCDGLAMPAWDKSGSPTAGLPNRDPWNLSAWKPAEKPIAFALAKDQFIMAYGDGPKRYKVSGFSRGDGARIWTVELPEQPILNRMALDRDGRVLVALCDGSLLCLGGPSLDQVSRNHDELVFHFNHINGGLMAKDAADGVVTGLLLTDASGTAKPVKGRVAGANLMVAINQEIPPFEIACDTNSNLCTPNGTAFTGFRWKSLRLEYLQGSSHTITFNASESLATDLWRTEKAFAIAGATITKTEIDPYLRIVRLTTDKLWQIGDPINISYPWLSTAAEVKPRAEQHFAMAPGRQVGPMLLQEFLIGAVKDKVDFSTVFKDDLIPKDLKPAAGDDWKVYSNASGVFDLTATLGPLGSAVAHAGVYVHSDADRKVQLWVGSGGGIKIILNGKMVHCNPARRSCVLDNDQITVPLAKGWNTILFAISQTDNRWGFCLRLRDVNGNDPVGLRYATEKP